MEEKVKDLERQENEYQEQISEKEKEASTLSARLKGEFEKSHASFKAAEEKRSKELVKVTSSWQNSRSLTEKAEKEVENANTLLRETETILENKEKEVLSEKDSIEERLNAKTKAEEDLKRLQTDFQNMQAGLSMSEGEEGMTLPDQIAKAHSDSKAAEAKVKQASMKMKHLTKELTSVEKQMKKDQKSASQLNKKREAASAKHDKIDVQMKELQFDESEFSALEQEKDTLSASVSELSNIVKKLTTALERRLSFKYTDPVRGFDRSKVKGLVAKLIQVKNPNYATAVEVVAGGKLYQVVVDEAIVGKAIIERGNLARRVTIIPLDKIRSRGVSHSTVEKAQGIAENMKAEATPAIELVGFDEDVRAAMEHVFGSAIVVDSPKAANQICDATKTKTVTLQGDVYDPSGTITGGSSGNFGTTLVDLSKLAESEKKLATDQSRLEVVSKQLETLYGKATKYEKLSAQLEIASAELESIKKHLSQTSYGVLEEKFTEMTKELEEAKAQHHDMQEEQEQKWALYHELKEKEVELTAERENRISEIEKAVTDAKKAVADQETEAREAESRWQTLSLEIESLKEDVKAAREGVAAAEASLKEANDEEDSRQIKVGEVKALYDEAKAALDEFEEKLSKCSSELSDVKHLKAELAKNAESCALEAKKLSVIITRIKKERHSAEKVVANLLKNHAWIESEKSAFGVEGGDYDFQATDPEKMSVELQSLKSEQDALSKKINKKVMGMIEKAEGEYTELLRKRKVVENDKKKIQNVIEELDVKKKTELKRTWQKVNKDFGSIFSTLLPGASAKLEPPEGMEAWEGLEVKVAFGDVWKESLSELMAGSDRSLPCL